MKRVWLILLSVVLACSLCACGKDVREKENAKETKRVPKAVATVHVMDRSMGFEIGGLGFSASTSEIEASQQLVEECIVMLKSDRVMSAVAEKYRQRDEVVPLTANYISSLFTFEAVDVTNLLRITAMCPDGVRTEEELVWLCNDLLNTAPYIIEEEMNNSIDVLPFDYAAIEYITIEI